MQYYEDDTKNRSGKRGGVIAVGVYLAAWVAIMLLVSFTMHREEAGGGMMIDFGDTDNAVATSSDSQPASASSSSDASTPDPSPQDVVTQDHEDAPTITPSNRNSSNGDNNIQTQQQTTPVEQPRQADPRLSFPGSGSNNNQQSQGTGTQTGTQGSPDGVQGGGQEATGSNNATGPGFSLAGRSVIGSLPHPTYTANKSGRVVVQITVNQEGIVTHAAYRAAGSTTNDSQLVDAARKAALQSRFNKIESDTPQTGTITYDFKLQ